MDPVANAVEERLPSLNRRDALIRPKRLLFAALVPAAILIGLDDASAQDLSCPSAPQVQTYSGTVMPGETTAPISVEHRPCEAFSMGISITVAQRAGSVTVRVYDGLAYPYNEPSNYESISCGGPFTYTPSTCSATWPKAASVTGQPFLGTRGESRAKSVTIYYCCGYSGVQISYVLTVTRTPRPGYNLGGTSTSDAPLQVTPAAVKASVHPYDAQYWKVQLPPGGTLKVQGRVRAITTISPAANLNIRVYNAAGSYSTIKSVNSIPGSSVWVPFESSVYTNTTGQTAFFWVSAVAVARLVDLEMTIVQDGVLPQLSLFLHAFDPGDDVNAFHFSAASDDDWPTWVPGARQRDDAAPNGPKKGTSVPLPQSVRVIAAYVDAAGNVSVPPSSAAITFELSDVSSFEGIAMNKTAESAPAFDIVASSALTTSFDLIDNTAVMNLAVWDYGALGTVSATHGPASATIGLPMDLDNNWIADYGWLSLGVHVPGAGQPDEDADVIPSGLSDGDGLSRFEEYRGFFVSGVHQRMNPATKDIFVSTELLEGAGDAERLCDPGTVDCLNVNYVLLSEFFMYVDANHFERRIINKYYLDFAGQIGNIPHTDQAALEIVDGGYYEYTDSNGVRQVDVGSTPIPFPPPSTPMAVAGQMKLYTQSIRALSPPSTSLVIADEPTDTEKQRQTLGHEVGHAVGIQHWFWVPGTGGNPAPRPPSVMVTGTYFDPGSNPASWSNIPHEYDANDRSQFRLR